MAFESGVDIQPLQTQGLVSCEIAWGDCACSLYSQKRGRERVVEFVDRVLKAHSSIQLLLWTDDAPPSWSGGAPLEMELDVFRRDGLWALPEGQVVALTAPPASSRNHLN
jgi:hypothetical protein